MDLINIRAQSKISLKFKVEWIKCTDYYDTFDSCCSKDAKKKQCSENCQSTFVIRTGSQIYKQNITFPNQNSPLIENKFEFDASKNPIYISASLMVKNLPSVIDEWVMVRKFLDSQNINFIQSGFHEKCSINFTFTLSCIKAVGLGCSVTCEASKENNKTCDKISGKQICELFYYGDSCELSKKLLMKPEIFQGLDNYVKVG
ncbi:hypothetical protein HZS_2268 [Henneguya salminicola]|nr:hypothetical protein HZS_2268 [Henneguya salminicola]